MAQPARTELEQEIINAMIDTKAINLDAVGQVISKYGERAAKTGTDLATIINKNFIINCGWPGPEIGNTQIGPIGKSNG